MEMVERRPSTENERPTLPAQASAPDLREIGGPLREGILTNGFTTAKGINTAHGDAIDAIGPPNGDAGDVTRTVSPNGDTKEPSSYLSSSRAISPPSEPGSFFPKGRAGETGFATPPGRRSVQFVRSPVANETSSPDEGRTPRSDSKDASAGLPRSDSKDASAALPRSDSRDGRDWRASLFNKLRAYASPSPTAECAPMHRRRHSDYIIRSEPGDSRSPQLSPGSESERNQLSDDTYEYETDEEADSEGSSDEPEGSGSPRERRRMRRPRLTAGASSRDAATAPSTPRSARPNFLAHSSIFGRDRDREQPPRPVRRTTVGMIGDDRMGLSEDEGRRRTELRANLKRRARELQTATFTREPRLGPDGQVRPRAIRRALTALQSTERDGDATSPGPKRRDRAKAQFSRFTDKARPRRKPKKPPTADQVKSAELVAELSAGIPAAMIFASMFQVDANGHKRIPVLLEQLKVRLVKVDEEGVEARGRHPTFHIQLEYGNGPTRMNWMIERSLRDLYNLYLRYRTSAQKQKITQFRSSNKHIKLPHFPSRAFPYLRALRGFGDFQEDSDSEPEGQNEKTSSTAPNAEAVLATNEPSRRDPEKPAEASPAEAKPAEANGSEKPRPPPGFMRRKSSIAEGLFGHSTTGPPTAQKSWPEQQRAMLEKFLQDMIRYLMFRPENTRLCKFLELSALGIRLAAEGSYHGKEGPLNVVASDFSHFRLGKIPSKWFVVRHSYVACVTSPEDITVTDVLMLDGDFKFQSKRVSARKYLQKPAELATAVSNPTKLKLPKHRLKLENSERRMLCLAKNSRIAAQFEASLQHIMETSPWSKKHRFDSYAPVRKNISAQWLVDGRDYMWNVSRAISMAKDSIYIHDWWLSPELYMRRPAAISREWRLDRLLKRKAEEGVRIFVIVYRNVESAIPIDSTYTKSCLLGLHTNIQVQRSPNQMRQGTFFWAHHEKLCIIDHTLAFVGGIDLCFGRWDTPAHELTDDKLTGFEDDNMPKDADHCQLWPGKDYSNPRVQDFFNLNQPYEEMYDRSQIPRMPWHDISMQLIGQPARDLSRHFIQRWNYILRQRKPSRPTPFLLPPPELEEKDLEALGLTGTCEVQMLRSAAMWSIGTPERNEHSIMNAYAKLIQESEHFVYIENQFFITSTRVQGDRIENNIGDALVERILRAARDDQPWRAVVLIPLMPGFQNTVDSQDGTSIRLIMLCQYRSICRGENSIFGRLLKEGIDPEDYIQFYGLRTWGKLGPNQALMTEQLYIHAKCMIVDDRSVIIGSANINERSMLGDRDSEVAAIVRDNDMLWSTMNGEPYEVGRFAHTLRMRLMREHLGIDVDKAALDELDEQESQFEGDMDEVYAGSASELSGFDSSDLEESRPAERTAEQPEADVLGELGPEALARPPRMEHAYQRGVAESHSARDHKETTPSSGQPRRATIGTPSSKTHLTVPGAEPHVDSGNIGLPPPPLARVNTYELGLPLLSQLPSLPATDDTDIGGPRLTRSHSQLSASSRAGLPPAVAKLERPDVSANCMKDPLTPHFYDDVWHRAAEQNTLVFRTVFRCMPDNEVTTWTQYKEATSHYERFQHAQGAATAEEQPAAPDQAPSTSGPPGAELTTEKLRLMKQPLAEAGKLALLGLKRTKSADERSLQRDRSADGRSLARTKSDASRPPLSRAPSSRAGPTATSEIANESPPELAAPTTGPPPSKGKGPEIIEPRDTNTTLPEPSAHPTPTPSDAPLSTHLTPSPSVRGRPGASSADGIASTGGGSQHGKQRRARAKTTSSAVPAGSTPTATTGTGTGSHRPGHGHGHGHGHGQGYGQGYLHREDGLLPRDVAEEALSLVQGHLVVWPYGWLAREEENDNWMYAVDAIAPLEIYN